VNDDTALAEAELGRSLSDLAATTTFDPDAWDRILERAEPGPGRRRTGPPTRWRLAVAAAALAVVGVGALVVGAQGGRDGLFIGTTRTGHLHQVGFGEAQVLVDGAALFSGGFACPDLDGDGRNELVVSGSYADPDTRVAEVSHERYRWDGDVLVSEGTTSEQVSYDDGDGDGVEDFREIGGANCGDLDGHL